MSFYLDGVESQLYHSALLRCERFGLLTNHVLLKTAMREAQAKMIELSVHVLGTILCEVIRVLMV